MADEKFARIVGNLLFEVRNLAEWGVDVGALSRDQLELEVLKRNPELRAAAAQKLIDAGLSQRKAAAAIGVDQKTISNDLRNNSSKSEEKFLTSKATTTRTAHEEIAKFAFSQPATGVPSEGEIRLGDFYELSTEIKNDSVDLIFTDPPYDDESLPLFGKMGEVAKRILKPGGSLITYCGHMQLLKGGEALSKHLRYWQPLCCLHSGPAARLTEFGVVAKFKPMLWFVKGTRGDKHTFVDNVVTGKREKDHHNWQQAECEAAYFIEALSPIGGLVVDFFAGGGTTITAAKRLNRLTLGYEINRSHHLAASKRVGLQNGVGK